MTLRARVPGYCLGTARYVQVSMRAQRQGAAWRYHEQPRSARAGTPRSLARRHDPPGRAAGDAQLRVSLGTSALLLKAVRRPPFQQRDLLAEQRDFQDVANQVR